MATPTPTPSSPWRRTGPRLAVLTLLVSLLITGAGPTQAIATVERWAASEQATAPDGGPLIRPEESQVLRLYRSVLGRPPDDDGYRYWVAKRIEGLPLQAVADGFLNSREYRERFGGGTDAEFLGRVYHNVLGRPGDEGGVDYWLTELSRGLARTELVLLFSESPENLNRTGTVPATHPTYRATVSAVSEADLGPSWRDGCPVHPGDLRAVEVDHIDLLGRHRRGTVIVHADVADEVAAIFGTLYRARYPVASIIPVDRFAADDDASMEANNTSAFNCRPVTGGTAWSRHSYGTAVDINPLHNPYVRGDVVLPAAGTDHVDRSGYHPAMIRPGDVVTSAFGAAGWRWGGDFRSLRDYQHFDR